MALPSIQILLCDSTLNVSQSSVDHLRHTPGVGINARLRAAPLYTAFPSQLYYVNSVLSPELPQIYASSVYASHQQSII